MRIHSIAEPHASKADVAACREMLRGGSRTFFAASLVLPASVRRPATGLYAFCRTADDAIDHGLHAAGALDELHLRLDRIYSGNPGGCAADRAFADVVSHFAIPRLFPSALLEGFAWDAEGRRYQNLAELKAYAVRVAGTVGAMMAMVMEVKEPVLLARACDLGVAMQLTNIARDVGEDARNGRLYLPLDWLEQAGIDPDAWLARPTPSPALARLIERLLGAAEECYRRSDAGLAQLPAACRPGMRAARLLYAEIGHEVARRRFDSVTQRAVVPWQRKARILADAMLAAMRAGTALSEELSPEAAYLFDALPRREASGAVPVESARERARWPRVEDRLIWLIDLFERLERRVRAAQVVTD
jgi:phytoene synthase